jgi:excisionase family DNA binding protein
LQTSQLGARFPGWLSPCLKGPETGEGQEPQKGATVTDNDLAHLRLLDVNELKDLSKISRSAAYRLVDEGELVSIRIGNYRRVRVGDLEAFLEARRPRDNMPNN